MVYSLLLAVAAIAFAFGGLFMKYSDGMRRAGATAAFLALFCFGAACQALAMRRAEMGVVYIAVLAVEAVVAFLISVFVLREGAGAARVAAVVLIVAGIVLLERSGT